MEAGNWGQATLLEVRTRRSPTGLAIVAPSGELDISNEDRLRHTIESLQPQVEHLVIDLTRLVFMGTVGLQLLDEAWQRAQSRHTRLTVVAREDGEVRHLLEISGFDKTLEVVGEARQIAS